MQAGTTTTNYEADNPKWIGSKHGQDTGITVTLDYASLDGLHDKGFLPSGMLVAKQLGGTGKYIPYLDGTTGDAEGLLLTQVPIRSGAGDVIGPMMWHGRVITAELPFAADAKGGIASDGSHKTALRQIRFD